MIQACFSEMNFFCQLNFQIEAAGYWNIPRADTANNPTINSDQGLTLATSQSSKSSTSKCFYFSLFMDQKVGNVFLFLRRDEESRAFSKLYELEKKDMFELYPIGLQPNNTTT